MDPVVSICCLTFNHGNFIRECLDSFISQQTSFTFEILIHDDASTDNTSSIIKEYERLYPSIIKPIYQTENQYSKGGGINIKFNFPRAKGKYLTMCEGDDFWSDPLKLQKQVDFLEENPGYVVAYHNAKVINTQGKIVSESKLPERLKKDYSQSELLQASLILTLSMCYRNVIKDFPSEIFHVKNSDSFLISLLGQYGRGKYLKDIEPACYRIHDGGVWSNSKEIDKHLSQANTFYHLYLYYKRVENKEISSYFKQKSKSKYKTAAIIALKSKNYISAVKSLRNIFRR